LGSTINTEEAEAREGVNCAGGNRSSETTKGDKKEAANWFLLGLKEIHTPNAKIP